MIEEIGTVQSIEGTLARVLVPRKSACEGCSAGICKPDDQSMEIEAVNTAGAAVGQKVRVAVQASSYLKGSMIVYGLPALSLVLGAVFGKEFLALFFTGMDSDVLSAALGLTAFAVTLIGIKVWWGRKKEGAGSRPVIEEILSP